MATISRSLLKALTFRIIATFLVFSIAYIFTGSLKIAIQIFIVHAIIATALYFLHELIWEKIGWGIRR